MAEKDEHDGFVADDCAQGDRRARLVEDRRARKDVGDVLHGGNAISNRRPWPNSHPRSGPRDAANGAVVGKTPTKMRGETVIISVENGVVTSITFK